MFPDQVLDPLLSKKPSCMLIGLTSSSPHEKKRIPWITQTGRKSSFTIVSSPSNPTYLCISTTEGSVCAPVAAVEAKRRVFALFGLVSSLLFLAFVLSSCGSVCLCPRCVEHLLQSDAWNHDGGTAAHVYAFAVRMLLKLSGCSPPVAGWLRWSWTSEAKSWCTNPVKV